MKTLFAIRLFTLCLLIILGLEAVKANPIAGFTPSKTSGCSPLPITFTNTSSGNSPTYFWDFGNGNTSTLINPSASFINPGNYTVKLTVTDNTGSTVKTTVITVFANPVADFTLNGSGICVGDNVCFKDLSVPGSGAINHWSWDFGDGNSALTQNPCNTYSFGSTFTVTLVVIDVNGCQHSSIKTNYITISPAHTVHFSQDNAVSCRAPLTVHFKDSTTPATGLYTYLWDFGDGTNSNQKNPVKGYLTKGNYPVSLTVTSSTGCKKVLTKPKSVVIHDPKAAFTSNITSGCAPLVVSFFNKSTAADSTKLTFLWKTSNGYSYSTKNPTITFNSTGAFTITLIATIPGVCSDTFRLVDYIHVTDKPTVSFTIDPAVMCSIPATVKITSSIKNASAFTWYFGDGGSSTLQNPSHTYTNYGEYTVSINMKNSDGCKDSIIRKKAVIISKSAFVLNADKLSGCKPLEVNFWANDTSRVRFTSWSWFINSQLQPDTAPILKHIFTDTGAYKVMCLASNEQGCIYMVEQTILVGDTVHKLSISTLDTSICWGKGNVHFTVGGLLDVGNPPWFIDYGDGDLANDLDHKYKDVGVYHVSVRSVFNGCNTVVKMKPDLTINGPRADFDIIAKLCPNDSVWFDNRTKVTGHTYYFWNLGNGDSSHLPAFKYVYPKPGNYVVKLVAYDSSSHCIDSATEKVYRPGAPNPGFYLTNTVGCSPLTVHVHDTSVYAPGSIKTREWGPFNTFVSPLADTVITYTQQGYLPVSLILTDTNGCQFALQKDSAVHVFKGDAFFSVSPSTGCIPLNMVAQSLAVTDNKVVKQLWRFGNGDSAETTNSSIGYTYLKPPSNQYYGYKITYLITDSVGCTFSSTQTIKPTWPKPVFDYGVVKTCGNDFVVFNAMLDSAYGMGPFLYSWKFSNTDFTYSIATNRNYSFGNDTMIPVKLIKRDANGCVDSAIQMVHSDTRLPKANYYANPLRIDCPGPPVYFYDTSIAGASAITKWEWGFGDGSLSLLKNPAKTYLIPGVYDINLKVTDSLGCTSTLAKPGYVIIAGPLATYTYTPKTGCVPLEVTFNAYSNNTKKYEWDLGDGWTDTSLNFNHVYTRANERGKSYKPNLTITDSLGCRRGLTDPDSIVVYPLPKPDFVVDRKVICINDVIAFTNKTVHDVPMKVYSWHFGDGDIYNDSVPFSNSFIHSYSDAGKITVMLLAKDTLECADSITKTNLIEVLKDTIAPASPHILRATVLNNDHVLMEYNSNDESDFSYYTIRYNYTGNVPTSFADVKDIQDTTFIQSGLNTLHEVYSYTLTATDVCKNESPPSLLHATVELTATGDTNAINLRWNSYTGWQKVGTYEIYRYQEATNDYSKIGEVSGDMNDYTDTTVTCFTTYYYKVKGIESAPSFSQITWSDSSGAVPIFVTNVPFTNNIRATVVNDKQVLIEWEKRAYKLLFTTVIYRSTDHETPVLLKEILSSDTSLTDYDVKVDEHSYAYYTYLKDNCGGLSPSSNEARTILLQADLRENDIIKFDPYVFWSAYTQWFTGVDYYEVQFRQDSTHSFNTVAKVDAALPLNFWHKYMNDQQFEYCYKVIGYKKTNNKIFSESNIACISTAPRLYAPNAFTINGDNLNEQFTLGGVFIDTYHIEIYNRYGEMVYISDDLTKSWDGTVKGKPCAADVYVYLAEGTGRLGQRITLKGNVTLLR